MTDSTPATSEDATGIRLVSIRCIVEYVEPLSENGQALDSKRHLDTIVRLPGHCPFDEIVIAALHKLGYKTRDITGAKGSLQFPNWNQLSCDAVTDNLDATVESILGELSSLVTLRIRLHGRPRPPDQEDIKDKLLSFLLQRLQTVLNNSGCPISQALLNEISKGCLFDELPLSTREAFNRWFREQSEAPAAENIDRSAALTNGLEARASGSPCFTPGRKESHKEASSSSSSSSSLQGRWPTTLDLVTSGRECCSPQVKKEKTIQSNERWPQDGAETKPRNDAHAGERCSKPFENVPTNSKMRLLPNRNAVYEMGAVLPSTPEPEVLIVTPEMPDGDADHRMSAIAGCQNEPTDLSVRREQLSRDGAFEVGSEPSSSQPLCILRPFRVAHPGQMTTDYRNKESRSPSPPPPPPKPQPLQPPPSLPSNLFMHAATPGFQGHLTQFQQHQQALQLAAMSRALNFHFGPSTHHFKDLSRGSGGGGGCSSPFAFKSSQLQPCPPTELGQPGEVKVSSRDQKKRSRVFIDPLTEIPKLERWFSEDTHPSSYVIEKFTEDLNRAPYRQRFPKLEPKNLQLWFKNHRAKMKRHREVASSHATPSAGHRFDVTSRTPSPGSFYCEWAERVSRTAIDKMAANMASSNSPSSTGSRNASSSPQLETKSNSDCSDDDMDVGTDDIS